MFRPFRRRSSIRDIAPDEIFLDSTNLPDMEASQFEGRVERPVSRRAIFGIAAVFLAIISVYGARAFLLQVVKGATYAEVSRNNTLESWPLFAERGLIFDRVGKLLAWNEAQTATSSIPGEYASSTRVVEDAVAPYAQRRYTSDPGFSVVLGFLRYPRTDASGNWWRTEYTGISGIELGFDSELAGENGSTMVERDAHHHVVQQNITTPSRRGEDLHLSIDADVQTKLYQLLSEHARKNRFTGGAAVIMDVRTGELLAITTFPEYGNQAFTDGDSAVIRAASNDTGTPLLNRAVGGLYAPGSIVKPILAAAALNEGIISPEKQINSVGAITLPNPYNPDQPSIFRDWTVHGWVDMRTAIAVSSDEYFYTIGGGYGGQEGLGIARIDEYARRFGLGQVTGFALGGEKEGTIPTPEWKLEVFGEDDPWRIGNTYHTAIGQFGFQITPLQAAAFAAAIANGGKLLTPQIIASSTPKMTSVDIPDQYLQVVRDGMRMAVTSDRSDATVKALNIAGIEIAGKTGTAQIGARNEWMNSWSIGFWPADNPKYAYAVVLEKAPAGTLSGASPGLNPFFYWLIANKPEYVK
ncbi:MAG TPA: penicillin-binding transpeptidase domain-containing protein [Candidatus Paceibacterota bacterium]